MASIYEISDKYKFIQSLIEDGADAEVFAEALNSINGELTEKLENYAAVIKNIESDIAGLKSEEQRLAERCKSMESNVKRMKESMRDAMVVAGQTKIKGQKFNFNIQKNRPSLYVLDENLIPRQYVEVVHELKIDKKAILSDLKNGVAIDGVEIQQGESIRIK